MFKQIQDWFRDYRISGNKKKISVLYKKYTELQRRGKLDEAGKVMSNIEFLEAKIRGIQDV